ncbi:hypothetical protein J437_LFUL019023 [Ladona fulva]|uniref:C-type lectin domain-containing protein n=1 Tax=Ladona fulva TaxID=123851 RepID=A0A8K0PDG0_LADFU|nr:hypothetical protein J437_LFUL019023 [Ladona fulva]
MQIFPFHLAIASTLLWFQQDFTVADCLLENQPGANTIKFTVKFKKNQTDHQVTQFQLNKASGTEFKNWKGDFLHTSWETKGVHKNYFVGTVTAAPQRPEAYDFIPGLGYYKFHKENANFVNATNICRNEGGHLAIINSNEEAAALAKMAKGHLLVWIGVHDPKRNGEFRTIFEIPLKEVGFSKWKTGQPDGAGKEFCIYFHEDGHLYDGKCEEINEFLCEYDLSWDDF